MMKKLSICLSLMLMLIASAFSASADEYKREIYVNKDGSGDYRTITEALEAIRAYMDYTVTVHIANGVYQEKVIIPSWLTNVEFIGESVDSTIITNAHHANINKMGTFRTYTVRVDGCDIIFRNLTIENNAPRLGQAVALHTEGDCLCFINCRLLGNQDTLFIAGRNSRLFFDHCYIEGTTDFIFGPATALFTECEIRSKADSYITAASTPENVKVGYVFDRCRLTAYPGVSKVYLGRPWRPYGATAYINCEMGSHITQAGWDNWRNPENEKTARYAEYGSKGPGASDNRASWAKTLTAEEADALLDAAKIYTYTSSWQPSK